MDDQPCICGHGYEEHVRDEYGCLPCSMCNCDCDCYFPSIEDEFYEQDS